MLGGQKTEENSLRQSVNENAKPDGYARCRIISRAVALERKFLLIDERKRLIIGPVFGLCVITKPTVCVRVE
jgi:hypothetical protein